MTPRELAAQIYLLPYRKREERLSTIPYPERAMVEQYLENMGKGDEVAAKRRGKGKHPWDRRSTFKRGG